MTNITGEIVYVVRDNIGYVGRVMTDKRDSIEFDCYDTIGGDSGSLVTLLEYARGLIDSKVESVLGMEDDGRHPEEVLEIKTKEMDGLWVIRDPSWDRE